MASALLLELRLEGERDGWHLPRCGGRIVHVAWKEHAVEANLLHHLVAEPLRQHQRQRNGGLSNSIVGLFEVLVKELDHQLRHGGVGAEGPVWQRQHQRRLPVRVLLVADELGVCARLIAAKKNHSHVRVGAFERAARCRVHVRDPARRDVVDDQLRVGDGEVGLGASA
eukprot:5811033-Pleurochrysis_carterae.AAC.1